MKITVEMSAEEFEEYRAYQKEKESLKRKCEAEIKTICAKHEELCAAVCAGLELKDAHICELDRDSIKKAIELAAEWYA